MTGVPVFVGSRPKLQGKRLVRWGLSCRPAMRLKIFDKKRSTTTEIPQPIFTQLSCSTLFLGRAK
jgi:hypothetical protein